MEKIIINSKPNWHLALAMAVRESQPGQTIVVFSKSALQMAKRAAERMDKEIVVEITDSL